MKSRINKNAMICPTLLISMLFAAPELLAQNAQNTGSPPAINGTVVGVAADHSSFDLVDRTGKVVTVALRADTSFLVSRNPANMADVIKFGMEVRGTFAEDGSAAQVTGRGFTSQLNANQLQAFMDVSDAEWALLKPKIEKIQALQRVAEGRGNGGNNQGNNGNNPPAAPTQPNPIQRYQKSLQTAFFNLAANPGQVKTELQGLREARAEPRADLATARKDLTDLLTPRQEVLLVIMGILE